MSLDDNYPVIVTTMVEDVKNRGGSGYVVDHMKSVLNEYLLQE